MEALGKADWERTEVLIVEDSRTQAAYLNHILEQNGYRVHVARNGGEALGFLDTQRPALVVSDIDMPGINGYELAGQSRRALAVRTFR